VLSHVHVLREVLASLPTENPYASLASAAVSESSVVAPISLDQRTHFARLLVIDDVAYNGRQPGTPILRGLHCPPVRSAERGRLRCHCS